MGGVQRKILRLASGDTMSWVQCRALADKDAECGDTAYGAAQAEGAVGPCRCVLKGRECLEAPSKSGNNIYKRDCPKITDPTGPCSGAESIKTLDATKAKLAELKAEVEYLKAQLAEATGAAQAGRLRK